MINVGASPRSGVIGADFPVLLQKYKAAARSIVTALVSTQGRVGGVAYSDEASWHFLSPCSLPSVLKNVCIDRHLAFKVPSAGALIT